MADGSARTALWLGALALDYGAPLIVFRVPGLRPVASAAWNVQTSHFAERFQLFVIIALGESIVLTGATTSDLELGLARMTAFALAFLASAALWWLYFTYVARIAERRLELAADRTTMARDGYTYLHVVLVAGVIVSAVGDELVIAHPTEELPWPEVAAVVAGPAIYLLAHVAVPPALHRDAQHEAPGRGRRMPRRRRRSARSRRRSCWPASSSPSSSPSSAPRSSQAAAGRARGEPAPLEALEASVTTGPQRT